MPLTDEVVRDSTYLDTPATTADADVLDSPVVTTELGNVDLDEPGTGRRT